MSIIGGMSVKSVEMNESYEKTEVVTLGKDPYNYEMISLPQNKEYTLENNLHRVAVVLLKGKVILNNLELNIDEVFIGDCTKIKIKSLKNSQVLFVYFKIKIINEVAKVLDIKEVKRVEKPWGYEIWYTGDPSIKFAFKKIYIKETNKTSLQVHSVKRESNFIVEGSAKLHYSDDGKYNKDKKFIINSKMLESPTVIDVFPNMIHRLEAITDIVLFEVSTTELDDVIRLEDDTQRESGRVIREHKR